jgi:anti-sigma factor RsiW
MREALVSYLYNEATAAESRAVESHLEACAACRQEFASFERVRGMLQQWQLDDLPVVRVETASPTRRSALAALKELISVAPLWTKLAGACAMALLVFAVMGTEVSIGSNGFTMRADMFGRGGDVPAAVVATDADARLEQLRAEIKTIVNREVAESERAQSEALKAQLVSFESQIQNMHAADLARLAARIQEQRAKIKTLERDIDRREGIDLTDILFSELTGDAPGQGSQRGGD